MKLFHATGADALQSIAQEGLHVGSYWTSSEEIVSYYSETIRDEGRQSRVLSIDLSVMEGLCEKANEPLEPDYPGIEEPIAGVLGKKDEQIWQAWRESGRTWRDSLNIVRSLVCPVVIDPALLNVVTWGQDHQKSLAEHLQSSRTHKGPQ